MYLRRSWNAANAAVVARPGAGAVDGGGGGSSASADLAREALVSPARADLARTSGCAACGVGVEGTDADACCAGVAGGGTEDARVASVRPRSELELGMAFWCSEPSLMSPAVARFSPRRDTSGSCAKQDGGQGRQCQARPSGGAKAGRGRCAGDAPA